MQEVLIAGGMIAFAVFFAVILIKDIRRDCR